LSAGRVQSVALRLIVQREREIQKFTPKEYWEIEAELQKALEARMRESESGKFIAKLQKINNEKVEIKNKQEAGNLIKDIENKAFRVADINQTEKKRNPLPPFITSTLQQEAFNKLRFTANRTMIIAQQLYEGVEIGKGAPIGLITYMRTDSTHLATSAIKDVRNFILNNFGKNYLPIAPNIYKTKKLAQEAHEAIRPTSLKYSPENLKGTLNRDQYKLYELIYKRFIASQMTPARYRVTNVSIAADKYLFSASGTKVIFPGFTRLYPQGEERQKELCYQICCF